MTPVLDYQHCYEGRENQIKQCVASQKNYFQEDRVNI